MVQLTLIFPKISGHCCFIGTFNIDAHRTSDRYPIIIGRDLMLQLGMTLDFREQKFFWDGIDRPFCSTTAEDQEDYSPTGPWGDHFEATLVPPAIAEAEARQEKILDAQYKAVNLDTIVPEHLTKSQGTLFRNLLKTHKDLFAGRVGTFLGRPPVELTLKPDAKPINLKAYNVPKAHKEIAKREVQRLVDCGVLRRISDSPWGFPSFFIPKKNQQMRIVTDLQSTQIERDT
jgi:hypothetical protein